MPTQAMAKTQAKLQAEALRQLAIIGGALTKDDDIRFEGRAFVFPERYAGNLQGLKKDVVRYVDSQEEAVIVQRTFEYRPFDGAYATWHCLKQYFGYAQSKARQGMFGPEPPREIDVHLGFIEGVAQHQTVPWGDLVLPGLPGSTLTVQSTHSTRGDLFVLQARCRKADQDYVNGFFNAVAQFLEEHSIYRGKALNGRMEFFDTDTVDPNLFVFTQEVWAQAETNIFSPVRDRDAIARAGLSRKRVSLLEGPFGSGKSGLGRIAAKVAVSNGVTAFLCTPGVDDPLSVLQTAMLYMPALIFVEDIDIIAAERDPAVVTRILDTFDGPTTKNLPMTVVMTTNHVEEIHKGMMRSGRIDAIMHIGAMDRPGVQRLCELVIAENLAEGVDWDAVYEATVDYMPAYVKEAIERALRFTIARTGQAGQINGDDLVNALHSLRPQYALQEAASDRHDKLPALDQLFRQMIAEQSGADPDAIEEVVDNRIESRLDGASLVDSNGNFKFSLRTN